MVAGRPAGPDDGVDATIGGSARDLLALLLGRPARPPVWPPPRPGGDVGPAAAFGSVVPGP